MQNRDRPEPELGRLDDIDPSEPRRPAAGHARSARRRSERRGRAWPWLALAIAALAAGGVYLKRDALRSYFPGSETHAQLNAAARAEADGRWFGSGDGQDALGLYRGILEIDPDNDAARLGLRRVGERLAADAEAAIAAGEFERADARLAEMAAIGEAGDRVAALRQQLDSRRTAGQELTALLERAQAALARRRIRGDDGALAGFKRMLARDPGSAVAQRGIDDALDVLIEEANKELAAGRIDGAQAMADAVTAERAQHAGLPALRQAIAQAQAQARERSATELAAVLAIADDHFRAGRLDEAASAYRRVLARDGERREASEGLSLIAAASLDQARQAIADSDPVRAEVALTRARRAGADAGEVAPVELQLVQLNERLTAVLAQPELDPAQQRELDALMARARAADGRGELVEPAGDSAYDLYRRVLSIDPTHEDARRAVDALPRRAQALTVHHIELGDLERAGDAVEALQAMAPMDPSLPVLQRQLAGAWLDRGVEAARSGAIGDARLALDRARALAPAHPGIDALARELSGG